jgi:hypothetical protein
MIKMLSENSFDRTPIWPNGTRLRLLKDDHHKFGEFGKVVAALANPSRRPSNQWYDIRFDDGRYGRFLARHLQRIPTAAAEDKLGSAA